MQCTHWREKTFCFYLVYNSFLCYLFGPVELVLRRIDLEEIGARHACRDQLKVHLFDFGATEGDKYDFQTRSLDQKLDVATFHAWILSRDYGRQRVLSKLLECSWLGSVLNCRCKT